MSMQDYSFTGYGIVLNDVVDQDVLEEMAENDDISSQYSFTGEAFEVKDDGCEDWGKSDTFDDNTVYFVELPKYPRFFRAAYRNMDALMDDMERAYRKVKGLPRFGRKRLRKLFRSIQGTYYG